MINNHISYVWNHLNLVNMLSMDSFNHIFLLSTLYTLISYYLLINLPYCLYLFVRAGCDRGVGIWFISRWWSWLSIGISWRCLIGISIVCGGCLESIWLWSWPICNFILVYYLVNIILSSFSHCSYYYYCYYYWLAALILINSYWH